jgi:L-lysine exporter family protein LysE/ArgO
MHAMQSASLLSNGFFLSLSLCLDIGIVNLAILTLALQRGFRAGFWLGFGSCFGDLLYALLALAGMAVLLRFDAVRWVVWLGGGAALLWFTWRMACEAFARSAPAESAAGAPDASATHAWRSFARGVVLALSSPSAILWFAAVGGALIARAGATTPVTAASFLSGFFLGGLAWTTFICMLASQGGKLAGPGLMRVCHVASALLFAYLSYDVIVGGYRQLILGI